MWASSFIHLCTCTHVRTHTHTHAASDFRPCLMHFHGSCVTSCWFCSYILAAEYVFTAALHRQTRISCMNAELFLSLLWACLCGAAALAFGMEQAGGGGGGSGCIWRAEGWRVEGVSGLWFGVFRLVLDDSGPEPTGDIPFSG